MAGEPDRSQVICWVFRRVHEPFVNSQELITFLIDQAPRWVVLQRDLQRPNGRPLSPNEAQVLAPFFGPDVVHRARITDVPVISNPDFYETLATQGIPIPLDFTQMSGITLVDTILISSAHPVPSADWLPLLFHELVHVVQYQLLGAEEFIRRYVNGWARNGFRYETIPLEQDAYALEARFTSRPHAAFSVLAAVTDQLGL